MVIRLLTIAAALVVIATAVARPPSTGQLETLLDEAQQAYDEAIALRGTDEAAAKMLFEEAATRYGQVVDAGADAAALHYNFGNALLQADRLGEAILHYRIAAARRPGDSRVAHNLAYARSLGRDRIEAAGGRALVDYALAWHHGTSMTLRTIGFTMAWSTLWILLLVIRSGRAGGLRVAVAVAALLAIVFGASIAASIAGAGHATIGVLTADEVTVRKGNGEGFEPSFAEPLHAGVETTVIESRAGWHHVAFADGNTGWVPDDAIVIGELR